MMNQNRIEIQTVRPTPKKVGLVNVKKLKTKNPGTNGNHAKNPINPASGLKMSNINNPHAILINIPPIIPDIT